MKISDLVQHLMRPNTKEKGWDKPVVMIIVITIIIIIIRTDAGTHHQ